MNVQQKEKGFTIIEVVLVLAIAGLIFMMVFIALPALQRSQRDTQRKNDLSRAVTALTNYTSTNRGSLPTAGVWNTTFKTQYLTNSGDDSFVDPAGACSSPCTEPTATSYMFVLSTAALPSFGSDTTQNTIYYSAGYTCDTDGAVKTAGSRKVALRMALEGGGVACQNN